MAAIGKTEQVILIHPQAPAKPALGQACNGCGVCCLLEPCPLGQVLMRRRQGACAFLAWHDASASYRCTALTQPQQVARASLPPALAWLTGAWAWALSRWARRWIAAGIGCDCAVDVQK